MAQAKCVVMTSAEDGEREFEAELLRWAPNVRAFAGSLCSSPSDAEDLAQDTIARALRHRTHYVPGTNMRAWLFAILHNQFKTERRNAWRASALDDEMTEALPALDNAEAIVTLKEVREAISGLRPEHQEVLILIGGAGLSYEEGAEILGLSMGTLKSRLNRARAALYAAIEPPAAPPAARSRARA